MAGARTDATAAKPSGMHRSLPGPDVYKYALLARCTYANSDKEVNEKFLKDVFVPAELSALHEELVKEGEVRLLSYEQTNTEVVVAKVLDARAGGHELVLCFRGTQTMWDWKTDLTFVKTAVTNMEGLKGRNDLNLGGCEVHEGFLDAFNNAVQGDKAPAARTLLRASVGALSSTPGAAGGALMSAKVADSRPLMTVIDELFPSGSAPPTRVVTCGHSLGAALCTLAAFWAKAVAFTDKEIACYAFASPRVGSPTFAAMFNELLSSSPVYRFTHNNDPVPAVPPQELGFDHVGSSVFLKPKDGAYSFTLASFLYAPTFWGPERRQAAYDAQMEERPGTFHTTVGDHSMKLYIGAIASVFRISDPQLCLAALPSLCVHEDADAADVGQMAAKVVKQAAANSAVPRQAPLRSGTLEIAEASSEAVGAGFGVLCRCDSAAAA